MTKRHIPIAVIVIVVLIAGGFWYEHTSGSTGPFADYTEPAGPVASSTSGIASDPVATAAWQTFEQYLSAAKTHNLSLLKRYTYKLSTICANRSSQTQCFAIMDRVAQIGLTFKESDFKNVIYDNRQIILSTDWRLEESNIQIGYGRSVIYFTRDTSGAPHVLFFTQPEEIIYSFIDPTQTHAQLVARLNERIKDSDGDMLEDEYETCSYEGAASSTPPCVQTDPHKMDTNGDGWWDSTEQYLK